MASRIVELVTAVNIGPGTNPESFRFAENVWYCLDQPSRSEDLIRLPVAETDGRYGIDPESVDEVRSDLRLEADSPVNGAGVRP